MPEIEVENGYTVQNQDAYDNLVGFTSFVVDEIYIKARVDTDKFKIQEVNTEHDEGSFRTVDRETLSQLLKGGYISN